MAERKVVITGLGAITPLGNSRGEFWEGLLQGKSGIRRLTFFDASSFSSQIAGEVKDFLPEKYIEKKEANKMDRFSQLAVVASLEFDMAGGVSLTLPGDDVDDGGSSICPVKD